MKCSKVSKSHIDFVIEDVQGYLFLHLVLRLSDDTLVLLFFWAF